VTDPFAPGWPGIPAHWTSSAKSGLGTAVSRDSRVWFTLSHGILNEIYVLPVSGHTFMLFVGIVEMSAAVLVAARPRIGAHVVAAWLFCIIGNLLLIPGYFDVALRDFGLALGALALARLSEEFA
jgi:hypothetical protein